jgi:outer membrane lipoprotein SlyB
MNKFLLALALIAPLANAAEIVGTTEDNRAGEVFGSGVGVLLGGAAGGPVGALIGAGIGYMSGEKVQQGLGQSGTAYLVEDEQGHIREVRRNRLPKAFRTEVSQLGSLH